MFFVGSSIFGEDRVLFDLIWQCWEQPCSPPLSQSLNALLDLNPTFGGMSKQADWRKWNPQHGDVWDEGGKPLTSHLPSRRGEDPSLFTTSDAIRVASGLDCNIAPSALLEMFHAFQCSEIGGKGILLLVSTSCHPHIFWGRAGFVFVQSVSIDLNFSWWVLTSLPPLQLFLVFFRPRRTAVYRAEASELIILAISWTLVPPPQPSHSSRGTGGNWSTDLLLHHGSQPS